MIQLLRISSVIERTGLSRSSIYSRVGLGVFPKQLNIGARAVGWPAHEIDQINQAFISGMTPDQIFNLVQDIHSKRKQPQQIQGSS